MPPPSGLWPVGVDAPVFVAAPPGPGRRVARPAHAHRGGDGADVLRRSRGAGGWARREDRRGHLGAKDLVRSAVEPAPPPRRPGRATGRRSLRIEPHRAYPASSREGPASRSRGRRGWISARDGPPRGGLLTREPPLDCLAPPALPPESTEQFTPSPGPPASRSDPRAPHSLNPHPSADPEGMVSTGRFPLDNT